MINVDKEPAEDAVKALEREVELLQATIEKNTNLGFDNTEAVARLNEVLGKLAEVRAAAAAIPDTVAGYQLGENGIEAVPESGSTSLGGPRTRGGKRKKAAVNPVSLPDFKPPPSRGGRGGGRGRGGGSGGSGSADELQREIEQIQERTAAIQAETAAQAGLNPLLNDFGYAVEFAASKQDLLNAAKSAGKEITPELAAQIDTLAAGYANASSAAEKLAATQDKVREQAEFFGDAFYDAFSELIPKIETGNKRSTSF
ncbi:hypothetical protein T190_17100 [Sinorhizobium meliloti CCBAU 01290]|nr:hypothetical protein T190_17100 [Sinorhizobium meliloti CCBAU 01290]